MRSWRRMPSRPAGNEDRRNHRNFFIRLFVYIWNYVYNPVRVKFSDYANEKIPAVFRFGVAYHFSDKLLTTAEVEKNTNYQPVILRGGIEYRYKKQFFFRIGFGTSRDIFSFGFGWHKKHIQFDIGTTMHQSIGFSPQTSLVFAF